jgi:hypothetical protein
MNLKINTGIASLLLLLAVSCTKEGINKQSSSSASLQSSTNSNAVTAFTIGQHYHGGIIFYIDNSGQHGLIAAVSDQGTGIKWKKGLNKLIGATGTAVGTGAANTQKIVDSLGTTGSYAALLCFNYVSGTFKDWYLPSKAELNLLYQKKDIVGGFAASNYWSSSEVSKLKAWDQEFGGGFQFKDDKSFTLNVRAISSF